MWGTKPGRFCRLLTGSADKKAQVWNRPSPWAVSPERIALSVTVLTGMEVDKSGTVRVLDPGTWRLRREQLVARLHRDATTSDDVQPRRIPLRRVVQLSFGGKGRFLPARETAEATEEMSELLTVLYPPAPFLCLLALGRCARLSPHACCRCSQVVWR
jgi:hypothetical protein